MESKKYFKATMIYTLSMLLPRIVGFFMLPIYSRYLTPDEYGVIVFTISITSIYGIFSMLILSSFYLRFYFSYENTKDFNGTIYWGLVLYNTLLLIIEIIITPFLLNIFKIDIPFYPIIFIALISQFLLVFESIPMRMFRIMEEVNKYFYITMFRVLLMLILNIVFLVVLDLGVLGRLLVDLVSNSFIAVICIFYMIPNSYFKININLLKKGFKFSLPLLPSEISSYILNQSDRIIMGKYLDMTSVGLYSMGYNISNVTNIATRSVYQATEPSLFKKADSGDFIEYFMKVKSYLMPIVLLLCFTTGLFAKDILIILTAEEYWAASDVVQILVISTAFFALTILFNMIIMVEKRPIIITISSIIASITLILTSLILIGPFNFLGVAIANVISYFLMFLTTFLLMDRKRFHDIKVGKDIFMILCMIILFLASYYLQLLNFNNTIFVDFLFLFIFLILLLKIYRIPVMKILENYIFNNRRKNSEK